MSKKLLVLLVGVAGVVGAQAENNSVADVAKPAPRTVRPGAILVDQVAAVIQGVDHIDVVLDSDVRRHSFDGQKHSLDELVLETVKDQRGKDMVTLEDEDIDRQLRLMSPGQDVSRESLGEMSKNFGYNNVDEFYTDLKRLYRANAMQEQEIRSMMTVSEQEIADYFAQNPEFNDAVYYLQTAHVPLAEDVDKKEQKKQLENSSSGADLRWGAVFDVADSDLASQKAFVRDLRPGQVHVYELQDGFELYRLKRKTDRQLKSLEDRHKEILGKIRERKFNEASEKYNKDCLNSVKVTKYSGKA